MEQPSESLPSLKLTAKAPENGWLKDDFPFSDCLFSGVVLVLGLVTCIIQRYPRNLQQDLLNGPLTLSI